MYSQHFSCCIVYPLRTKKLARTIPTLSICLIVGPNCYVSNKGCKNLTLKVGKNMAPILYTYDRTAYKFWINQLLYSVTVTDTQQCLLYSHNNVLSVTAFLNMTMWSFQNCCKNPINSREKCKVPTSIVRSWVQKRANFILRELYYFAPRRGQFLPG